MMLELITNGNNETREEISKKFQLSEEKKLHRKRKFLFVVLFFELFSIFRSNHDGLYGLRRSDSLHGRNLRAQLNSVKRKRERERGKRKGKRTRKEGRERERERREKETEKEKERNRTNAK
jgi:hypothetical protein